MKKIKRLFPIIILAFLLLGCVKADDTNASSEEITTQVSGNVSEDNLLEEALSQNGMDADGSDINDGNEEIDSEEDWSSKTYSNTIEWMADAQCEDVSFFLYYRYDFENNGWIPLDIFSPGEEFSIENYEDIVADLPEYESAYFNGYMLDIYYPDGIVKYSTNLPSAAGGGNHVGADLADTISQTGIFFDSIYITDIDMSLQYGLHMPIEVEIENVNGDVEIISMYYSNGTYHWEQNDIIANNTDLSNVVVGDYVFFGTYEQDGNSENGVGSIEWIVLDKNEEGVLLISKNILEQCIYHDTREYVTWEDSYLRAWLNEEFYNNAFSEQERAQIISTVLHNGSEIRSENDTTDNVFCLSQEEVMEYLMSSECTSVVTANAAKNGVFFEMIENYEDVVDTEEIWGNGFWWTRTGGAYWQQGEDYADLMARYVGSNAYSEMYSSIYLSENYVTSQNVGVRPAIWVSY